MRKPFRNIEQLFFTPIHVKVLTETEMEPIQKEMADAYSKVEWSTPEDWGMTHDLSNDFLQNDIDKYNMHEFKKLLHEELEMYCGYLGFPMRKYNVYSWFSRFKPGDYGHTHHHSPNDIAGCYYFKTNGKDGNIYFNTPNDRADASMCYMNFTKPWHHEPVEGKLMLFPGWLPHGIKRNTTEDTRVSFAFNIVFERF